MPIELSFPTLSDHLPELGGYVRGLAQKIEQQQINDWQDLEQSVKTFFTPQRMNDVERVVPGWIEMSSYAERATLVHVLGVTASLRLLPQYQQASTEFQALAEWTALLHDLAKIAQPQKRDALHGFRSAALAARLLPNLGFPATPDYPALISEWFDTTWNARLFSPKHLQETPDNNKLPEILAGIRQMFGETGPTGMLVQTILLHVSLALNEDYPPAAPVSQDFIRANIDRQVYPLFEMLGLADSDSWCLGEPAMRDDYRQEIADYFARL